MKHSVIRLSLILLVIHFNYGFSLPRIDLQHPTRLVYKSNDGSTLSVSDSYVEKPTLKEIIDYHLIEKPYPEEQERGKTKTESLEDTIDLFEDVHIDPRKDEPVQNNYSTEIPKHGKRQRRDVSTERIPSKRRPKRTFYRNWVPFTSDLSRMHTQQLPEYVEEILTEQKPVVKSHNQKYAYVVGHLSRTLGEKENEVLYDSESNDELDSESSSDESNIVDDNSSYTEEPNVVEYLEYYEVDENNSSEDDTDVSTEKEEVFDKDNKPETSGIFLESTTIRHNKDSGENSKVSDSSEEDWKDNTTPDDDSDSDEDSGSLEDDDIGCEDGKSCAKSDEDTNTNFDDILNEIHQIFIEENSTIQLSPATIHNPQNFNVLNLFHNVLKDHSKSTNQDIIIKTNPNQPNFLDALRGLFTNIVKNNVIINNHVPITPTPVDVTAEKDRLNDSEKANETTKKPVSEQNFKEHSTTTESPKEKVTSTVDKINEKTNNSNHIDQNKDKDFTAPPLESATATAIVNEKEDSADVNKKIDFMLDLVNNENFWKFMGDLGGKYLESLMEHTQSVIKEQITTQVKEHLDALNKYDEKLLEKKEEVKENKPVKEPKETAGGKNREAKNINETVSIKAHNLFGNTVGNDKVTNVYVFYANEHIDEIIKNIHEIANKTKPVNSTNIFTFISNHLEVNNETSIPATSIVSKVTTELPKTTVSASTTTASDTTIESTIEKHDVTSDDDKATVTTESIKPVTSDISSTPEVISTASYITIDRFSEKHDVTSVDDKPKVTTESMKPVISDISSTTEVTSTASHTIIESTIEKHDVTSDDDKAKVTTESMKPVTSDISSTTEVTSKVSDTTIVSSTEKQDVTSDDDKAKVTTESMKPVTSDISSTTEVTSTVSDTTIVSSTEKQDVTSDDDKAKVTTESMKPVTSDISSTTEVTSKVSDTTIVSSTEKQDVTSDDNKAKVTTESMKPVTSDISSTTEVTSTVSDTTIVSTEKQDVTSDDDKAKVTTESMKPVTSDISSTTEVASTVSDTTIVSSTEKQDVTSDADKAKVTTESMKPVTSYISSTTEVTSTVSDTTIVSSTEKQDVTSDDDKAKVTTESMKPVTSDISSTTEVTSTTSDTTIESTIEQHDLTSDADKATVTTESMKPVTNDISSITEVISTVSDSTIESTTEKHDVTGDDVKSTTESMKPVTNNINSSTEFASYDTASSTDHTESDLKDTFTTKSVGEVDEENSGKSTEPSLTKLSSDDDKTNTSNTADSVTTETVDISVDQADKNHTILNIENSNSTADHSEILSTTETPEHKTDSINITAEAVTEKTDENNMSNIITEKSESTKTDTEMKEATESTTEKHEEDKS